jgi:acyl-CoA dehydrogenase
VRFQVVQHQLARLASDVAMMEAAADAAVIALSAGSTQALLLVAAAKGETSSLARAVTAVSHQLHGAIGFTQEHRLGVCTKRLWAWRDEDGNELVWQERMSALLEAESFDVWGLLTGVSIDGPTGDDR